MATKFQWDPPSIDKTWRWSLDEIQAWQLKQLNAQLAAILPQNKFYSAKLGLAEQLKHIDELSSMPFTSKEELVASAEADEDQLSGHHTFNRSDYSRLHRTSGTTGNPLMILDTEADWRRWSWTWQHVLEAANLTPRDCVFLAFSFGPFIGFWSAHQACVDRGATVVPGGGLSSVARLDFMRQSNANVLCCTPSYALHLADVARQENIDLRSLKIDRLIVAGEAGGSVPSVREKMASLWGAQIIDHSGATEVGPWGFGWPDRPGLHVIETSFIAELIPIKSDATETTLEQNQNLAELVLTSLGRVGAPVFRYRTGDIVLAERGTVDRCGFLWLPKGVIGRTDDMIPVRGINVFPSSIDAVVRRFQDIAEYQVLISERDAMTELEVLIETSNESTSIELTKELNVRLGLRIPVRTAQANSLPRTELKAKRWIRRDK
ncbi:MAG: AMP-binding protein [Planctomycetota bacterium]